VTLDRRVTDTDFFVYQVISPADPACRSEADNTSCTPGAGTRVADVTLPSREGKARINVRFKRSLVEQNDNPTRRG
jgi:hypothetical protein